MNRIVLITASTRGVSFSTVFLERQPQGEGLSIVRMGVDDFVDIDRKDFGERVTYET